MVRNPLGVGRSGTKEAVLCSTLVEKPGQRSWVWLQKGAPVFLKWTRSTSSLGAINLGVYDSKSFFFSPSCIRPRFTKKSLEAILKNQQEVSYCEFGTNFITTSRCHTLLYFTVPDWIFECFSFFFPQIDGINH